ncbi:EAL domain-containing protein [Actinoplanes sp. NEAU-A11]|uniref:EAL domain-containing protein n=2 Tax=Actinoplanes aureus TaxID=2792083 RepID=A0A931CHA5_9ACTN|nr:EAL domain-containing protein [Actinoplanes aureus]
MDAGTHAPWRYVAATAVVALLGVLWYAWWTATGAGPLALCYVFMPVGCAMSALAVSALCRSGRLGPVARRFWRWLGVGSLCLTGGYSLLAAAAFAASSGFPPMPLAGALLVCAGVLAAIYAVVRVPLGVISPSERVRQWLDRGIAFLGCTAVLWHFGLAPLIWSPDPWSPSFTVMILLAFLLAAGGITKVSYLGAGPVDRVAVRLVAATGLCAAAVAVLAVRGSHETAILLAQAVILPAAPLLLTLAVRCQWNSTGRPSRQANTWLPYLAVAAVDVPVIDVLSHPAGKEASIVALSAVVVTGLVLVRQYVVLRENTRLLREKRASEERLRFEATHDALTGLANRALFRDWLAVTLRSGDATVLLVDLDDFKTVNDSLGHDVGDELLVAFAETLRAAVGDDGRVVRLGGDEFAVLTTGPGGEALAGRIMAAFRDPISAHRLLVRASVGIASAPAGTAVSSLLRDADVAMYTAKQRGKANWVRYATGMEKPLVAHAQIGGDLRRALDAGEFRLVYQPLVELRTRRVIGVEALVRWMHPERGMVSPAEFIPAAERTGLIVPLGRFVLRETCRQSAAWLAEFGPDVFQKAGPNVSVRQLHDPEFVAEVRAALADSGFPAERLILELTESAVLRGPQVSRALHELNALGVRLALDDFGTGESSLSLLRAFPAAIVKLDKSFVDGIELDEPGTAAADARQAVARAVVQLSGALGLDTVAEGIENEEQAQRLMRLGYTTGQGYHLGRPMEAEQITRLLAAQRDLIAAAA